MIEQINIALEQKYPIFSAGSLKPAVGDWLPEREYTSIKSDEEWTSCVLPSEQDDIEIT